MLQKAAGTVISFVIFEAYARSINAMKMQMNY